MVPSFKLQVAPRSVLGLTWPVCRATVDAQRPDEHVCIPRDQPRFVNGDNNGTQPFVIGRMAVYADRRMCFGVLFVQS